MSYVAILGRQPAIGRAELESCFGAENMQIIQPGIVQLDIDEDIRVFDQIGGTLKVAKILTDFDHSDWPKVTEYLQDTLPDHLQYIPEGKITLGISAYGLFVNPKKIEASALSLKKVIKQHDRSARIVPNKENALNTAQVIHNKLTEPNGLELLVIKDDLGCILAQTVWVQDIEAYRRRDQERPYRDSRVGMLPPKLAQIIINLATGDTTSVVLDPFCGTGVILQEAVLMEHGIHGSDLDARMVEYSVKNLQWLSRENSLDELNFDIHEADATDKTWEHSFDTIACETYLGRPLSSLPDQQTFQKIIQDCDTIHKKFLRNVARQTKPGFRMCIAVPAWALLHKNFKHLPTLDKLTDLGYNRIQFVHAEVKDLIYHRPDQYVGRELVVLERI